MVALQFFTVKEYITVNFTSLLHLFCAGKLQFLWLYFEAAAPYSQTESFCTSRLRLRHAVETSQLR